MAGQEKRKRRHHTVPRFHLKGFANDKGLLRQIDLTTGGRRLVSIGDASVEKDFYTIELDDGSRSDVWENRLADMENQIAPVVRAAAAAPVWIPTGAARSDLSAWIALQYLRGSDHRRMLGEMRAVMVRMVVGMGGLAYLQHTMSQGLGRPVPLAEATQVWDDIHQPEGPTIKVTGRDHITSIQQTMQKATEHISSRSWHRIRFEKRTLAINDSPVALIPAEDHPSFLGVGLMNAGSITVALDRRTLLWLAASAFADIEFPPSTLQARAHNQSVVFGADRFVYTHPDDEDPTAGLPLPRPTRPRIGPGAGTVTDFANRDRPLNDVLAQIETHDDSNPNSIIANYTWPIPGYAPPTSQS